MHTQVGGFIRIAGKDNFYISPPHVPNPLKTEALVDKNSQFKVAQIGNVFPYRAGVKRIKSCLIIT